MRLLPQRQNGQALIIVLLVMAVIMTVTLSVVSRSLTDITISTYEEDALRAFSAAEAGIEKNLFNLVVPTTETDISVGSEGKYSATVQYKKEPTKNFMYPSDLNKGEVVVFWLVDHYGDQLSCGSGLCFGKKTINIHWGRPGTSGYPGIVAMVYYDNIGFPSKSIRNPNDYSDVKVESFPFDPNPAFNGSSGFNSADVKPGGSLNDVNYRYKVSIDTDAAPISCLVDYGCVLMIKVRMLFNNEAQPVAVKTQGNLDNLPPQGYVVNSVGEAGESTRSISVFQSFEDTLDPFDSAVFSGTGGLTK